jgi:LmbE family N-acetylglucosaminyl deacetylase
LLPLPLAAQLEPPSTGGYAALDHALRMLGHEKRVLMIAAHPDDEDTELLTVLVRGMGAEAAYLSLNRGEGGQNLIGDELGEALGLLRTEELLAARRLDGAHQFFTRVYDFGFSKNLDDTWAHWPRDSVLKDVVRTIRQFRPQIIVSIFTGTPRDGHGQHQAAGWAAQEAFRVAGDSSVFPELLTQEGLTAFAPLKLYRSTRFDTAATTVTLDGGALDPAVGQSYHQIAMRGRSLHRSQDMGQLQGIGPSRVRIGLLQDRTGTGSGGLWSGIDTTFAGIGLLATIRPAARVPVLTALGRYAARVDSARASIGGSNRDVLRALLDRAATDLAAADRSLGSALGGQVQSEARALRRRDGDLLQGETERLASARLRGGDLVADLTGEYAHVVPGEALQVTASLWNPSAQAADAAICLGDGDIGWRLLGDSGAGERLSPSPGRGACLGYDQGGAGFRSLDRSHDSVPATRLVAARLVASVPESEDYSTPYFLRQPRVGDMYQWDPEQRESWGLPFEAPRLALTVQLPAVNGTAGATREATLRGNDQGSGEFRRPVTIVPRVDVRLDPDLEVWPLASRTARTFTVTLTHGAQDTTLGRVRLELPDGWTVPAPRPFRLTAKDQRESYTFVVRPPASARAGTVEIAAVAEDDRHRSYDVGLRSVDHPHIHPRSYARRAVATVRLAELQLPAPGRVAYLRGAADRLPEALQSVGLRVEVVRAADLSGDLSRYRVIVIGPRAFETDADLPERNPRLLAYARSGGTVITQYQQYGYFLGNFAPYPLTVGSRPPGVANSAATTTTPSSVQAVQSTALLGGHDRVTDERSPVTIVDAASAVLRRPNRIGAADWDGWVQERGLYFAHTWDDAWTPVLEMHDPGEPPLKGGLLIARVGKGTYVYTGLSFFRQLPAGVPGAWRLFANLLALGTDRPRGTAPRSVPPRDSLKIEAE